MVKSHEKKCQNYLLKLSLRYNEMCRHVNFEEMDSDSSTKKMMNFAHCEQYLTNISKQNIIMAVLRKRNSHSVAICRLIKKLIM